jgi:hypothetical protein
MVKQQKGKGLVDDLGINKVKTGFINLGNTVVKKLDKTAQNVQAYGNMVLHGRDDLPPKVRDILKRLGDQHIQAITINRTPVNSMIMSALGAVSQGEFTKRFENSAYDQLFHLRLDLKLANGKTVKLEKNEVINMDVDPTVAKDAQTKVISSIPPNLTPNMLVEGAKRVMGDKFIPYNAVHNNCQDFIMGVLDGSKIGDSQDREFVKQYTKEFFKGKDQKYVRDTAKFVTDLGAKVNEITTGVGLSHSKVTKYKSPSFKIQSILFDRKMWTLHHAKKWLKKHGFKTSVDTKPEHLRFRQQDPDDLCDYRTKDITDGIKLIVGHSKSSKNKSSKYINMNSDTDESSSDEEMEGEGLGCGLGLGLARKKNLIQRMAKLSHDLHDHHHTDGHDHDVMEAVKLLNEGLRHQLSGGSIGGKVNRVKKFNRWFKAIGSKFKTLNHNLKPIKEAGTDYAVNYINPVSGAENALNDFQREVPETVEALRSVFGSKKESKKESKPQPQTQPQPQYSYTQPTYSYQQPSYSYQQPSYSYDQPSYTNPFADSWSSYSNHMYGNGLKLIPTSKKERKELRHDINHPMHSFNQVKTGVQDAGKTIGHIISDVATGNFDKLQQQKHMPILKEGYSTQGRGRGRPKKQSSLMTGFKVVNSIINPRSISNGMGIFDMPKEAEPVIQPVVRKVTSNIISGTGRPKKGSQEAKDKMARIRAMRKK